MVWVMEHAPASLTGTEQSVALVLANFADEAGGNAFPSVSRLAACTHWSERAVQSALRSLTGAGVISIESEATNRQPASYCFPLYRGECAAPLDIVSRGADGASRGAVHDARGAGGASRGAAAAPYTSLTVKEPSKNRQGRAGGSAQRRKPETRVDPDFYPEAKLLSWTEQKGWDVPRVAREVEAFIAHHQKLETLFRDWNAGWRTWVLNGVRFDAERATRVYPNGSRPDERVDRRPAIKPYEPGAPKSLSPEKRAEILRMREEFGR
jgi:hypothetical protein